MRAAKYNAVGSAVKHALGSVERPFLEVSKVVREIVNYTCVSDRNGHVCLLS